MSAVRRVHVTFVREGRERRDQALVPKGPANYLAEGP
jgi:hypothetical protein